MAEATGNETVSDIYRAQQTKLFIGEIPKGDDEEHEPPIKSAPLTTPPIEPESVFPPDKKEP